MTQPFAPLEEDVVKISATRMAYFLLLGVVGGALSTLALSPVSLSLFDWASQAAAAERRPIPELFTEIYQVVHERYVTLPDDSKLIEGAIKGLIVGLDPHSEYLDAQTYRTVQEEARGVFGGLGLQVAMENSLIKVVASIPNSHAAKAGLRPGDLIIRIDGVSVRDLTVNQSIERMRGPVDSKVRLAIYRKGQLGATDVLVARDLIRVQTVFSRTIGEDVGYIRIAKFNDLTAGNLQSTLEDLSSRIPANRLRGYILDLRNNPGGVFEQALSVASAFLTSGDIVTTRGRNPEDNRVFTAAPTSNDLAKGRPLIVLINGGSASAAEIVAGALQDRKRATVLGTQSFGKGSVQSTAPIGDGNALKLTTAFYYTPGGHSIQAKGITPDIEVMQESPEAQRLRAAITSEANLLHHLKGEGEQQTGSEAYVPSDAREDNALKTAIDLLRGAKLHPAFPANRTSTHD
jgi:carboxyl-terminal processing protease